MTWRWNALREAGGGGAARVPQLQPIDASVVAAWKNEYLPGGTGINGMQLVDYGPNGYNGSSGSGLLTIPDIVPGRLTQQGYLTNYNAPPGYATLYATGAGARGLSVPDWGPQCELLGDLTLTVRVAQSGAQGAFSEYQYIYAHGDAGHSGATGISFGLGVIAGSYEPFVYWEGFEGATPSLVQFSASMGLRLRTFQHVFVSLVRDATAKTVRLGIDGVYETQSYTVDPVTGANRYVHVGEPPSPTGALAGVIGFAGIVTNPVLRDAPLTDTRLEVIRKLTMGL